MVIIFFSIFFSINMYRLKLAFFFFPATYLVCNCGFSTDFIYSNSNALTNGVFWPLRSSPQMELTDLDKTNHLTSLTVAFKNFRDSYGPWLKLNTLGSLRLHLS